MKNKSLVIVESPAKAKTIKKYLGNAFEVMASVGHVRDLPKSKFGVNVEDDFKPEYTVIKGKGKILKAIKSAARSSGSVYLAPDPDREGEAIAWHIAQELNVPEEAVFRVTFNEITSTAIKKAFASPGRIDLNKVDAQQTRRILDRIVGYRLSPILWRKVKKGLSAGRVQSVALRLVCEREEEIRNFKPKEYWTLDALLKKEGYPEFKARLEKIASKKSDIKTGEEAGSLVAKLEKSSFIVSKTTTGISRRNPAPPFITSQLQQEAYRRFRFSAKKTMTLAQKLYEGVELPGEGQVGLITYIRTDSPRVSKEAQNEARSFIEKEYGSQYLPPKPNSYAFKKERRAQDAHECIRPTSIRRGPGKIRTVLDSDLVRLYDLIWSRFMASQMVPARFKVIKADITARDCLFKAKGTTMLFDGHLRALAAFTPKEEDQEKSNGNEFRETSLPPLEKGDLLALLKLENKQNFTQPPARYSEGTLIKALEEKGIGRPSTYATILATIQTRDYTEKIQGRLQPTELGFVVNTLLVEHFPEIFNVKFTAGMEDKLDLVEEGKRGRIEILNEFYPPFMKNLDQAFHTMKNIKKEVETTDVECEKCGKPMVIRWGKNGKFLACSGYPECKNAKNFNRTDKNKIQVVKTEVTTENCEKCGQPMVIREGRFGKFMACSGYPKCRNTKPMNASSLPCPMTGCSGFLVPKVTKRKRRFYGCNRYPECKFATWDKPDIIPCPDCGSPVTVMKKGEEQRICPRPECQRRFPADILIGIEK